MSRKTYRWIDGALTLVAVDGVSTQPPSASTPYIQGDLPGYASPIDGKWIEGRRARREDLKRSNSRPWEGRAQEEQEAAKVRASHERSLDQLAHKMAHEAWAQAPERIRKVFRYK